jgi:hypothetical protein
MLTEIVEASNKVFEMALAYTVEADKIEIVQCELPPLWM